MMEFLAWIGAKIEQAQMETVAATGQLCWTTEELQNMLFYVQGGLYYTY